MEFYSRFNPAPKVTVKCEDISLTQQSFAADADINNIIRRYTQTGVLVDPFSTNGRTPQFGDFSVITDFHTAQTAVCHAREAFNELPSDVRKRFNNDPGQLLAFLADSANMDEAIKLGLVNPPEKASPADGGGDDGAVGSGS